MHATSIVTQIVKKINPKDRLCLLPQPKKETCLKKVNSNFVMITTWRLQQRKTLWKLKKSMWWFLQIWLNVWIYLSIWKKYETPFTDLQFVLLFHPGSDTDEDGEVTHMLRVALRQRQIPSRLRKFLCLKPGSSLSQMYWMKEGNMR